MSAPRRKPEPSPPTKAGQRRPLFDPAALPGFDDATGAPSARDADSGDSPWSVTELAFRISDALAGALPKQVRVAGEVSGFTDRTHWYFSLKDQGAVASCVMFAPQARRSGFTPANGQEVIATGRVDHFAKQGRTQLYVDRLEPVGVGSLELAFRRLFETLKSAGYFDPARKQPLPGFPGRVAVVTSRTGAALQDVLDTLRKRAPMIDVLIVDVRVQGKGAAAQIADAIAALSRNRASLGVDAVILTRGGGSMEDLWAFNERVVADALLACALPTVAAIGHETDVTIAELVADERAATPTQAAMRVSPDRVALIEQLDAQAARLRTSLRRRLAHDAERLRGLARLPVFADPHSPILLRRKHVRDMAKSLSGAGARALEWAQLRLERDQGRLEAVSPLAVLSRGYSVTTTSAGEVVVSAKRIRPGDVVHTRVRDGAFASVVDGKGARTNASKPQKSRRASRDAEPLSPDSPGLFG